MSRKRYISTDISTDAKVAELSSYSFLAPLIYTWSIPHMDDWGRITGDAREFKMQVCPGLDITVNDVEEAIKQVVNIGLWIRYNVNGKWCIAISKPDTWFKHQSYINKSKRDDDSGSNYPSAEKHQETPKNAEEHQETAAMTELQQGTAQIAASFSSSSSVSYSVSSSPSKESTTPTTNPFRLFESEGFGTLSATIAEKIGEMIDFYSERWVIEAMKKASIGGKRSLPYVEGILKGFKSEGVDEPWTVEKKDNQQKQGNVTNFQRGRSNKPSIPIVADKPVTQSVSPDELEELRKLARKLDGKAMEA